MRYSAAPGLRRRASDRVLEGGSPLTFVRLSPAGARLLGRILPVGPGATAARRAELAAAEVDVVDRLVAGGMLVPEPEPGDGPDTGDVAVVVPAHGRPAALSACLTAIADAADADGTDRPARVVVVDDGSPDPSAVAAVAARHGVELVRRDRRGGPGAARNTGWRAAGSPAVAFVDSDVEVEPGWLTALAGHLADPGTGLVAPRVRTGVGGASWWDRVESARNPLDLGPVPGPVRPGSRVTYVPAAALLVRRELLERLGGFDESLALGEDVDLCWRAHDAGWRCWYTGDGARVTHPRRPTVAAALRQRFAYGTTAAALDRRHPGAAAPVGVSGWSVAVWVAAVGGHPLVAGVIAVGTTAALARRLGFLDAPLRDATRLAMGGHLRAGEPLARALVRPWFPLTLVAAAASPRLRRLLPVVAVAPALLEWSRRRPRLDPLRWVVAALADDVAYSAGVWAGCVRERHAGALRPELRAWPGRGDTGDRGARTGTPPCAST